MIRFSTSSSVLMPSCSGPQFTCSNTFDQFKIRISYYLPLMSGAQPRLKSWGGPRFGSQHRGACAPRPAKGRVGCWVREGPPSRCEGPGVWSQENFWKLRCIRSLPAFWWLLAVKFPAFWWLLAVKFLAFWKLRPKSWGPIHCWSPNLKVGEPVSPGPYGCCAYGWC